MIPPDRRRSARARGVGNRRGIFVFEGTVVNAPDGTGEGNRFRGKAHEERLSNGGGMQRVMRILMVDADVELLGLLRRELDQRSWSVRSCGSGEEALRLMNAESYDAVTLDPHLPDMDGWSLLSRLLAQHADCVVMLLSGDLDIDSAVRAMRMGARDVLRKPVLGAELDERLREVVRTGQPKGVVPPRQQRAGQEPVDARSSGVMLVGAREPLRDLERRTIHETWSSSGHNLSAAARALGLPRTTLRDRLRKYGLR